ncbi:hypothetical protein QTG54_005336 [Skeletonema marinoi]|uniref:Subtilisin n=1 Tax=Skeletonema marinoi TaxID=267567 RepID=A0AAD8YC54_9STRA|nr:hypothetical protein QTG54_005336 [Skeletonema marinoi]
MMLLLLLSTLLCLCASAYQATTIPPLIDVPTFSLSTSSGGDDASSSSSTMNILTYASPVAIKPHRMWSISLYKGTLSHENFIKEKRGILQLLRPAMLSDELDYISTRTLREMDIISEFGRIKDIE